MLEAADNKDALGKCKKYLPVKDENLKPLDIKLDKDYKSGIDCPLEFLVPDTFISKFSLNSKTDIEKTITMTYFAFTSLSTVGFGDLHPRSDYERLFTAFILLFGVAIFSFVMGNFIDILNSFKTINDDFDEGDNLSRFFGLIK